MVQLSHPYMTTRKTIAWIIWTFVDKVMSLLHSPKTQEVTAKKGIHLEANGEGKDRELPFMIYISESRQVVL